jgi:hypothetical protein
MHRDEVISNAIFRTEHLLRNQAERYIYTCSTDHSEHPISARGLSGAAPWEDARLSMTVMKLMRYCQLVDYGERDMACSLKRPSAEGGHLRGVVMLAAQRRN